MTPALFDLSALSPAWRSLVEAAFVRGAYPWETLLDGLRAQTGRTTIPIDTADLSRWGQTAATSVGAGDKAATSLPVDDAEDHGLDHHHDHDASTGAHLVAFRRRALGLAWYSGRITLEETLLPEPELAAKVLWFELAHMADFFGMDAGQRRAIYAAFHGGEVTDHGHGSPEDWFGDADRTGYWHQVGEALMPAFAAAFAGLGGLGDGFAHVATPEVIAEIRRVLLPPPAPPDPELEPDPATAPYFARRGSLLVHDRHRRVRRDVGFDTLDAALAAGYRPCRVCKPRP